MLYNKRIIKFTAQVLLVVMIAQVIAPVSAHALTSGPSQPEVQSFEPVGTTDMVDLFTGDFVYNIPLLDVEGYPVNISYHAGIDMEQEASWVGLGWNINPGVINRTVRGIPDDFKGDVIEKMLKMKEEQNIRIGLGAGVEIFGVGDPMIDLSLNANASLNISNYRGVSADFSLGAGVNVLGMASAGVNLGVNSQNGADVDYNIGLSFNTSLILNTDVAGGVGFSFGQGYNTRAGVKAKNFGIYTNLSVANKSFYTPGFSATIPIGVQNVVPVITNASTLKVYSGQIKAGGEISGTFAHAAVYGMISNLSWHTDGSRAGYGYLYLNDANDTDIMDFTRDRDGMFNETMQFLPPGNMTYDVYSVTGQGVSGSFRPFRNDLGSVGDPFLSSTSKDRKRNIEAGLGNLFSSGADITNTGSSSSSGPWEKYQRGFSDQTPGSIYENVYFKQGGEATESNAAYFSIADGFQPINSSKIGSLPDTKPGSDNKREPRANLFYYFTGDEASVYGVASGTAIYSYKSDDGFERGPDILIDTIARVSSSRKGYQISEMVKVQEDGSRYVYGIPAMNNSQSELTFAVDHHSGSGGIITFDQGDNTAANQKGRDHFFSKTTTPAYAHSYLLTSVLSTDYVDIKGDGPTDDDFGSFTKFNYTLKNPSFQWRTPYGEGKAQFNPGFQSDTKDDKASYIEGNREEWILHSIETKNYIAEFYTSKREDGRGVDTKTDIAYKLDSILLFNKHDRFANTGSAIPVKTIIFHYDYSLCKNVPNNVLPGRGKLTLKKIYIRYGSSDKNMISPYEFKYGNNFNYEADSKDRWGAYKPNNPDLPNADFPFVSQTDPLLDNYAAAWCLDTIGLPSGGRIKIDYEADDYAYVQDKPAMEMFMLCGLGKSAHYDGGNQLYIDKNSPNNFFYFRRRKAAENKSLSLRDNYLKDQEVLYCNFRTRITANAYEPIKSYAKIVDVGYCDYDSLSDYGYIQVQEVQPTGGKKKLNPVCYTGINFARYYLPHVIFPGNSDDVSNVTNILAGLKSAFRELINMCSNPVVTMVKEGKVKEVKLSASFMRLNSPGLQKKGGGHRVKQLTFYDNWSKLAGGTAQDATYGKIYDYITEEGNYGTVSSGVASYEPQIGGDENPFRIPVNYTVQSGSHWPPNDPIGLYQELPVGESLYPVPIVGYSKVTVKSIHQEEGRSAQGLDIHEFYTAKDFPVKSLFTPINIMENKHSYKFQKQQKLFQASQGYSLIFNDMHGKPKRTETRILHPGSDLSDLVRYKQYNYFTDADGLSNNIPVLKYDETEGKMKRTTAQVGVESDLTIDTREKKEHTQSSTKYLNLNVFMVTLVPVPVPWVYFADFTFDNQFNAVVATKVIQQYGILKEVESYEEGALTLVRNEAFDPVTGQALVTSVNNEYQDKEYHVTYPAYWGYASMGPSYVNTGYTETFPSINMENWEAVLPTSGTTSAHYRVGDELLVSYTHDGHRYRTIAWVMRFDEASGQPVIQPRRNFCFGDTPIFDSNSQWPGAFLPFPVTITDIAVKVLRSGNRNQLNESIQSYATMDDPFGGTAYLKDTLNHLIHIQARTFSNFFTAYLNTFCSDTTGSGGTDTTGSGGTDTVIGGEVGVGDTIGNTAQPLNLIPVGPGCDCFNDYIDGDREVYRLHQEYVYIKDRSYEETAYRNKGLFSAISLWRPNPVSDSDFIHNYMHPKPLEDKHWTVARTITKWSPWGFEIENKDAIGNYTTAVYGYNQVLPIAIAQNARQGEVLNENFEDYDQLQVKGQWFPFKSSLFKEFFQLTTISQEYNRYRIFGNNDFNVTDNAAHTGRYALLTGTNPVVDIPVQTGLVPVMRDGQPAYLKTLLEQGKKYVISYWFQPVASPKNATAYTPPAGAQLASPVIEGWQRVEYVMTAPSAPSYTLLLPDNAYVDDIRILPVNANMKAFVYDPIKQRLVATLDENNYATIYEYDEEGNLVRTQKETERGIMTVMESRSAHPKK